jgi:hypothetical protein
VGEDVDISDWMRLSQESTFERSLPHEPVLGLMTQG